MIKAIFIIYFPFDIDLARTNSPEPDAQRPCAECFLLNTQNVTWRDVLVFSDDSIEITMDSMSVSETGTSAVKV